MVCSFKYLNQLNEVLWEIIISDMGLYKVGLQDFVVLLSIMNTNINH